MTQKIKPILFSTPMVQAILANRKFQTRRTKGLERFNEKPFINYRYDGYDSDDDVHYLEEIGIETYQKAKCPYGKVGDVLWIREKFLFDDGEGTYHYAASMDSSDINWFKGSWKPSIHMPKEACRIWLEITDIRIERLKDISEADAKAEGVEPIADGFKNYATQPKIISTLQCFDKASISFLSLWESINGFESSELNPWVWALTFKRVEKPLNF